MFLDFNDASGGGFGGGFDPFHNLPHYLLIHYGSFDASKYAATALAGEDAQWYEMHERLGQERVFSFDPVTYTLPENSGNIAACVHMGQGHYEWLGSYVYGSHIEPETARALISLQVPELNQEQLERLFTDDMQYLMNRNKGVSMIMRHTIAVYDPMQVNTPEIYCHPKLRKS